jgi:hypothetical protein
MGLLSHAHSNIKNTIHWLHNWNIKLVKEDEQVEAPEEWTVDLKQLILYLQDSKSLYFSELFSYLKGNLVEHYQNFFRIWQNFVKSIPKSGPKYFRNLSNVELAKGEYVGNEVSIGTGCVTVGLYTGDRLDVFEISENSHRNYSINVNFVLKSIGFDEEKQRWLMAGSGKGNSQILIADFHNKVQITANYPGEELTAFAYNPKRQVACLVTNERSMRIFDFEEI